MKIFRLFVAFTLVCFAISPEAQAVVPAPDGGYANGNTAEGQNALLSLFNGGYNTAVGFFSLLSNTTNSFNTAIGAGALFANTADSNTATGAEALLSNTIGDHNTANGFQALLNNTIGFGNTAIGFDALVENDTGYRNIALGDQAGSLVTTAHDVICIGAFGNNVDNSCYIGNIFLATSSNGGEVFVNSNGRLGTNTSSKRFKEDIRPIDNASQTLFSLKPVIFRYKKGVDPEGPEGKSEFGLVAEDVEKVNPDLVVRDKEGKPYSVRYEQVNAMLLNEFLKEHHQVQDLKVTVAEQQKQIEALTAGLQKVSAQLEMSKAAPQTVLNNQ